MTERVCVRVRALERSPARKSLHFSIASFKFPLRWVVLLFHEVLTKINAIFRNYVTAERRSNANQGRGGGGKGRAKSQTQPARIEQKHFSHRKIPNCNSTLHGISVRAPAALSGCSACDARERDGERQKKFTRTSYVYACQFLYFCCTHTHTHTNHFQFRI